MNKYLMLKLKGTLKKKIIKYVILKMKQNSPKYLSYVAVQCNIVATFWENCVLKFGRGCEIMELQ